MKTRSWLPLLLAAIPLLAGCHHRDLEGTQRPPVAPVVMAKRLSLTSSFQIASELRPYQEIDVYAKVSGYIRNLQIDWGTHVKKGQLLATLEIPELEHQLQRDRAAIRRSEHQVVRLREEVKRAESAYTVAHVTYARLLDVQGKRPELIAQQDIDVAEGRDREASASVSAANAALDAEQEALADAQAALKQDESLYAYARITAPFDGVVTRIDAYSGALLPAATSSDRTSSPLCHLAQNNPLRLVIPLPQSAIKNVRVGQKVDVTVATLGKTFPGRIALFSDQVDMQTRTMHTEVTVQNSAQELLPGMYASVKIPLHAAENVIALPRQAVQSTSEGEGTVLVLDRDDCIESRRVTTGIETASEIEIRSGVHEGDLVIFANQSQYRPGEEVTPNEVQPPQVEVQ